MINVDRISACICREKDLSVIYVNKVKDKCIILKVEDQCFVSAFHNCKERD